MQNEKENPTGITYFLFPSSLKFCLSFHRPVTVKVMLRRNIWTGEWFLCCLGILFFQSTTSMDDPCVAYPSDGSCEVSLSCNAWVQIPSLLFTTCGPSSLFSSQQNEVKKDGVYLTMPLKNLNELHVKCLEQDLAVCPMKTASFTFWLKKKLSLGQSNREKKKGRVGDFSSAGSLPTCLKLLILC